MDANKKTLLQWIEDDRDVLLALASELIRARSPNPPGDTRDVAAVIAKALDAKGLPYKTLAAKEDRPNIVACFSGGLGGPTLVLNGHMDVLPVVEGEPWRQEPWGGAISDGKVWGRGATNMKCGLAVALSTYCYLSRLHQALHGKLTFCAVSDEIILGDLGTQYLMKQAPEVLGDACLIAEPSGLSTIRFGEKGPMRLRFRIHATGGHGAFTHRGEGAIKAAIRLIDELETLKKLPIERNEEIISLLESATEQIDETQGAGASEIVQSLTITVSRIDGGIAKNMIPAACEFITDIRLPLGLEPDSVLSLVDQIVARHPGATVEAMDINPPVGCDPKGEIVSLLSANVKQLKGFEPLPTISLGCTDARLWRYRGIPAYSYGPPPTGMGDVNEYVEIDDFMHVMRTHALTAYDFLARG